ncbi:MAG: ABC transporter permease [Deltaproteobacteria bacterium]|jgi:ribose transport system permease protein|nr:ABC transporter permease [Deltaproteobacteria bacterium]
MTFNGKAISRNELFVFLGKYGTIIILGAMIVCFSILLPAFRSGQNLLNLLGQTAILSIFAAGMTCCLKMGDFDLSIGATATLTAIVVANLLLNGYGITVAITGGLLAGALVGLLNGILVAYMGLDALVCTLASGSIVAGLAMGITKGVSLWDLPVAFEFIGRGELFGIPNRFIIMILLLIVIWFFHAYTPTGRRMEAIGGNKEASKLSGINVDRNRFLGLLLSAICAAIAGVVLCSSVMSANATLGLNYVLDAFGACFIGAATIRIGQFHIWGTFVGVLIVVVAVNGLIIMMVPGYLTDMIRGIILLLAIFMSGTVGKMLAR